MAPLCCHRGIWSGVPDWASGAPFSSGTALRSPADSNSFAVLRACWLEGVHSAERPEARSTSCPCPRCCPSPPAWKSLSVPQCRYNCVQPPIVCACPPCPHVDGACLEGREPICPPCWLGLRSWELDTPGFASPSTTDTCVTSPGKETRGSGLCDCQGITARVYKTLSHRLPTPSELRPLQTLSSSHPQGPSTPLLWPVLPSAGVAMFTSVALILCM